jgi:hypothetical protein
MTPRPPLLLHGAVLLIYCSLITIALHFYGLLISPLSMFGIVVISFALGFQGGQIWVAYWRRRTRRRFDAELAHAHIYLRSAGRAEKRAVEFIMEKLAVEFKGEACPDCGSTHFNPGPRGGMAHNIRCAGCGNKFWYSPPFQPLRLIDSDDSFYDLSICRTLASFDRAPR